MAEFVMGLLLAKFVVATAFFVGMSMLLPAVLGLAPSNGKADWMASGFAVLLITAISPVALFQAIRFAHGSAGTVARDWGRMLPTRALTQRGQRLVAPITHRVGQRIASAARPGLSRARQAWKSRP